jgi:hypothetical protein
VITGIQSPEQTYPAYALGEHVWAGDRAECVLLHESPPDQELVSVVLLDCFICCESGKVIEIPRRQFKPLRLQEDL